jgi:adenylate cyclase
MSQTRRLAAILAADVAGYSRLMGADEEGTHERLKAHFQELVNPNIGERHGRVVKSTGDGLLAEFASVVDAVRCAAEIQRGMTNREPGVPEEQRIRFRVGSISATLLSRSTTSLATASMSRRGSKRWRSLVGFA